MERINEIESWIRKEEQEEIHKKEVQIGSDRENSSQAIAKGEVDYRM